MRENIRKQRRVCDECGMEAERDMDKYGANPFQRWLTAETNYTPKKRDHGPWDFCNEECRVKFLTKKLYGTNLGDHDDLLKKKRERGE